MRSFRIGNGIQKGGGLGRRSPGKPATHLQSVGDGSSLRCTARVFCCLLRVRVRSCQAFTGSMDCLCHKRFRAYGGAL